MVLPFLPSLLSLFQIQRLERVEVATNTTFCSHINPFHIYPHTKSYISSLSPSLSLHLPHFILLFHPIHDSQRGLPTLISRPSHSLCVYTSCVYPVLTPWVVLLTITLNCRRASIKELFLTPQCTQRSNIYFFAFLHAFLVQKVDYILSERE